MKVGDRVIVNGEYDGLEFNNSKGAIIAEKESIVKKEDILFCVEFDDFIAGHGVCGGKSGYCWWVPEDMLKKESDMKERIEKLEKELAELKAQLVQKYEPEYGDYCICGAGNIFKAAALANEYKVCGRAFNSRRKAEKARDIMVKHDIILKYVIDHAPEFNSGSEDEFWSVWYDPEEKEWAAMLQDIGPDIGTLFMPEWVAEKLADDLNNNRIEGM